MCVRAADSNIASKEKELQRLLEVLRIHADTHVVIWDHLANMVEPGDKAVTPDYLAAVNEFIRVQCSETAVSFGWQARDLRVLLAGDDAAALPPTAGPSCVRYVRPAS